MSWIIHNRNKNICRSKCTTGMSGKKKKSTFCCSLFCFKCEVKFVYSLFSLYSNRFSNLFRKKTNFYRIYRKTRNSILYAIWWKVTITYEYFIHQLSQLSFLQNRLSKKKSQIMGLYFLTTHNWEWRKLTLSQSII